MKKQKHKKFIRERVSKLLRIALDILTLRFRFFLPLEFGVFFIFVSFCLWSLESSDSSQFGQFALQFKAAGPQSSLLRLQQRRYLLILPACPLWRWASSFSSVQLRHCLFSSAAPLPLESCGKTLALFGSSFSGSLLKLQCKVECDCVKLKSHAPPSQPQSLWPGCHL
ncbi:hypothetical protein NE237_009213 [Protea cynaroides]|uniref:Uncharacterized protein n=1 Tax=Protea cynaroides TaxID=273540 RepID=A0A9Q0R031_9MAGN|nr:hypothetical protein NE237_009213 [Protea cynaroides]